MVGQYDGYVEALQKQLTTDLLKDPWKTRVNAFGAHPHTGHCYAASEALYHWVAKDAGFKPRRVKHEGSVHWFLFREEDEMILDPTCRQFASPVPYDQATGGHFVTKVPSKGALELLKRIEEGQAGVRRID